MANKLEKGKKKRDRMRIINKRDQIQQARHTFDANSAKVNSPSLLLSAASRIASASKKINKTKYKK